MTPLEIAAFPRLPRHAPLATRNALERRGVVVEGYVQRILRAVDGDLHLDFSPVSPGMTGRIQNYVVAEITPRWRESSTRWRYDRLLVVFRPRRGGSPWNHEPRRVRLSGWLTYDEPHEHRRQKPGQAVALSAWEIHPVTRIEAWDETQARFVEVPR